MNYFKQRDKQLHFLGGAVLSFIFSFISPLLGLFIAVLIGWLKEEYDSRHPKNHTSDPLDMFATWLGGVAGVIVFLIVRITFYG